MVFSHGWPLTADAWDDQMWFWPSNGYRGVAHDRRGHGRSSQPWDGNDMDTYADDLAAVIERSTCATSCWSATPPAAARSPATSAATAPTRVAKAVLVGAIPPLMLKTDANPEALPLEAFDGHPRRRRRRPLAVLQGPERSRSTAPTATAPRSRQGVRDAFWLQGMQVGLKARLRLHQGLLRDRPHRGPARRSTCRR